MSKQSKVLYDVLKPYLQDNEYILLNSEGWTKLLHYLFDDIIKEKFNMTAVKDRFWADSYDDGRRRVISVFLVNDMYATFKWGWNFEYIPQKISDKVIWCRTDKSIYMHTFEVAPEFITRQKHIDITFGRIDYKHKNDYKGFCRFVSSYLKVWKNVCAQIEDYYSATSSYCGMLNCIREKENDSYYKMVVPQNQLVYAFIEKYIRSSEAEEDFNKIIFKNEKIKQKYYQCFSRV